MKKNPLKPKRTPEEILQSIISTDIVFLEFILSNALEGLCYWEEASPSTFWVDKRMSSALSVGRDINKSSFISKYIEKLQQAVNGSSITPIYFADEITQDVFVYSTVTSLTAIDAATGRSLIFCAHSQLKIVHSHSQLYNNRATTIPWSIEKTHHLLRLNHNVNHLLRLTEHELAKGSVQYVNLIHPNDLSKVESAIQRNIEERVNSFELSYRLRKKDDTYLWVSDSTQLFRNSNGDVSHLLSYIFDESPSFYHLDIVSELRSTFGSLINSSDDLIFLKDQEFRYIVANDATCRFFGLPRNLILGKTDFDLLSNLAANQCREFDKEVLLNPGEIIAKEREINGEVFGTKKFTVQLENGKTGIGTIARNISPFIEKHQHIEREFRHMDKLLAKMTGIMFEAEITKANDLIIHFIAGNCEGIFHRKGEEFKQNPSLLIAYLKPDNLSAILKIAASASQNPSIQLDFDLDINGQEKKLFIQVEGKQIANNGSYWFGYITDVSKRKQAERNAEQSQQKLGQVLAVLQKHEAAMRALAEATLHILTFKGENNAIQKAVATMAAGLQADQGYYFSIRQENGVHIARHEYEWSPEKPELIKASRLQHIQETSFPEAWESIKAGRIFQKKTDDIPSNTPHKKILVANKVKATVLYPLILNKEPVGFIGFDNCTEARYWDKYELDIISTFGKVIVEAIERQKLLQTLTFTSEVLQKSSRLSRTGGWEVHLENETVWWSDMTKIIHEIPLTDQPTLDEAIYYYKEGKSRETVAFLVEKAIKDGTPWNFEAQLVTAKGNEIWVRAIGEAEFKDGKCVRLYGAFMDIDNEKRLKNELENKTTEYENLVKMLPVGIYKINETGRFTYVSPKWCEINGFQPQEILEHPENSFQKIIPEDRIQFMEENVRVLKEKRPFNKEARFFVNGQARWMRIYSQPYLTDKGFWEWHGVQIDISEMKQYEQALLDKNNALASTQKELISLLRQYEALLQCENIFIIKVSMQGNYVFANSFFVQKFGLPDQYSAIHVNDHIHREDIPLANKTAFQCIENPGVSIEVVLRKYDANNTLVYTKWEFKCILDDQSVPVEIQCIGFDITDQASSLEKVEELLSLTQNQNERLNSFAHIVSHNIRSHSANFSSLIYLMENAEKSEKQNFMELLKESAQQLEQTIVNLNEVVTVSENNQLTKERIRLKSAITDILVTLQADIKHTEAIIDIQIDDFDHVMANKAYLQSILLNFISNCIKYRSPDRKLHIQINIEENISATKVHIQDNGLGMDLETYGEQVFELYKTFHHNDDAHGYGLFITKAHVEAMGGTVEVQSMVNVGTTFTFSLPKI